MRSISLKDIAERTGYTVATVSLALRNRGSMAPATRSRIQGVARDLGYRPNPLLASLASKHFGSENRGGTPLAYIHFPEENPPDERSAQFLIRIGQEHAAKLGYHLDLFQVGDFKGGEQATRLLFHKGIQGILVPHRFSLDRLPGMDWGKFSVVGWGQSSMEDDLNQPLLFRAAVDHFGSVVRAWDETWKRGYRRIGIALFQPSSASTNDHARWAAANHCLQRIKPRLRIPLLLAEPGKEVSGLRNWIRRHRPEAIIGFHTWMGDSVRNAGFRIPQDVGFVSLHKNIDGFLPGDAMDPDAGVTPPETECVKAAVELLDQQIRYHQVGFPAQARTLMIHSEWMDGETLPAKVATDSHSARRARKHAVSGP